MNNDARELDLNDQFNNTAHIIDPIVRDLTNELIALFGKYNQRIQKNHNTRDPHQLSEQHKLYIRAATVAAGVAVSFTPYVGPALGVLTVAGASPAIEAGINLYYKDLNKKIDNAWIVRDHLAGENPNAFFQQVAFHVINNNRNAVNTLSQGKWAKRRLVKDLDVNTIAALKQDREFNAPTEFKIQTTSATVNDAIQAGVSLSKKSSLRTLFTKGPSAR